MIPAGGGRMIYVSEKSIKAILDIADIYRSNDIKLRRLHDQKEMADIVSTSIGAVLARDADPGLDVAHFNIPSDAEAFARTVRADIRGADADRGLSLTHIFGAWVLRAIP
jgi:hypothetical protein